jgi:hypothetical protein
MCNNVNEMKIGCPRPGAAASDPQDAHHLALYPLARPFYKLVQHHGHIGQHKTTYVKAKKLGCVPSAEFQTNLCLIGMSQSRVVDLAGDLVCRETRLAPTQLNTALPTKLTNHLSSIK